MDRGVIQTYHSSFVKSMKAEFNAKVSLKTDDNINGADLQSRGVCGEM